MSLSGRWSFARKIRDHLPFVWSQSSASYSRSMVTWAILVALSLCLGVLRTSRWTALVCPLASLAQGVYLESRLPAGYDMPGVGYQLGFLAAVAALIAWVVGRGARVAVSWVKRRSR